MTTSSGPQAPGAGEPADDLALFASFVRAEEQRERDAKKAARAERRKADEVANLIKAKEHAAAEVKRLRGRDGVSADQRAAADEAYRVALAAVVAAETGEAPAWAPEPVPADPPADADGVDEPPPTERSDAESGLERDPQPDNDAEDEPDNDAEDQPGDGAEPVGDPPSGPEAQ